MKAAMGLLRVGNDGMGWTVTDQGVFFLSKATTLFVPMFACLPCLGLYWTVETATSCLSWLHTAAQA